MKHIKILVVEDNLLIMRMACLLFDEIGCKIDCATSYDEAATLIEKNDYGLVLTDLGLPGKSGVDLAAFIRQQENQYQRKSSYICGATAYALSEVRQQCFEAGMDDLVAKPVNINFLKHLLVVATKMYRLRH
jgi:CheY-like chemotaxis protein